MRLRDAKGITEGRIDILYCEPGQLKIEDGYNVRDLTTPLAREKLDGLKAEIKEHGVQTPLKVRFDGEHIWIVEGHRRHTVVMELIAEFKASKGAEGRKIEAVPIYAEAKGTTPLDRDFGLKHSNSGEKLEPLEFANLIYRTIHQRGISEQEAAKGFGVSITVLRNHLAMRAMPEPVKEHVRKGEISATLASKISKNADPAMAEKLIEANLEENRRIKGSGKRSAKVTAKTIKRDAAKAKPPAQPQEQEPENARPHSLSATESAAPVVQSPSPPIVAAPPQALSGLSEDRTEPSAIDQERDQRDSSVADTQPTDALIEQTQAMVREFNRWTPDDGHAPSSPSQRRDLKDLIEAIAPVAASINETDLNEIGDDDRVHYNLSGKDAKRLSLLFARATGGEEIAA